MSRRPPELGVVVPAELDVHLDELALFPTLTAETVRFSTLAFGFGGVDGPEPAWW
jgi:hypothetical protein